MCDKKTQFDISFTLAYLQKVQNARSSKHNSFVLFKKNPFNLKFTYYGRFLKSITLETIKLRVKFFVYTISIVQYTDLAKYSKGTNYNANRKL